jgi:hypothetical protein
VPIYNGTTEKAMITRSLMKENETVLTEIGNVEAVCPNCSAPLPAFPARKSKCPQCGGFFLVRTRPLDRKKVLVTSDDAKVIEDQWNLVSGIFDALIYEDNDLQEARKALTKELGFPPTETNIKRAVCLKKQEIHSKQQDWGLYRNVRFQLSEFDRSEGKIASAFALLLEVCYLDLNGPNNCGAFLDNADLLEKLPPFKPNPEGLAPRIIELVCTLARAMKLPNEHIEKEFKSISGEIHDRIKTPLDPIGAWLQMKPALREL